MFYLGQSIKGLAEPATATGAGNTLRPAADRIGLAVSELDTNALAHCPACLWIIFAMVPLCQLPPFKVGMPSSVQRLAICS